MAGNSWNRFRTQGLLISLTSLSMAVLAGMIVQDAWQSTRQTLTSEAQQQCTAAVTELQMQFTDRATSVDADAEAVPFAAQDVSLQGLSTAVLRSYEGIEGGFLLGPDQRMAGHYGGSFYIDRTPQAQLENEARLVLELATHAAAADAPAAGTADDGSDILVGCAMPIQSQHGVAWVLKRLSGANNPAAQQRRWQLTALVVSTVLGLAITIAISIRLRHGVDSLNQGLARLEREFDYRLPPVGGSFDEVADAINRMADRRSALETTLRRHDRLAALGRVVAGVAHEIRNPLNALRLTLELLDRRVRRGIATEDEIRLATQEVDRLDEILARLLAFGRPGSHNRRVQKVLPLVERAIRVVDDRSSRKRVNIELERQDDGHLLADVDALAIEQILINLLLNAVDASPEQGVVTVAARAEDEVLRIDIVDRGPGIDADAREQIFNPYFTTKENGTGLGLAVSREMAYQHGGSLEFESSTDSTTFTLRLSSKRTPS